MHYKLISVSRQTSLSQINKRPGSSSAKAGLLRDLVESSTCSYNVAKVYYMYIWVFYCIIYITFIMLLLYAILYICYCTFSVFIVYWIFDFTSFYMSWIFLYSIIFNVSLSYHVNCKLCCLDTVFSLTRERSRWDLQSTAINHAQPSVWHPSLFF